MKTSDGARRTPRDLPEQPRSKKHFVADVEIYASGARCRLSVQAPAGAAHAAACRMAPIPGSGSQKHLNTRSDAAHLAYRTAAQARGRTTAIRTDLSDVLRPEPRPQRSRELNTARSWRLLAAWRRLASGRSPTEHPPIAIEEPSVRLLLRRVRRSLGLLHGTGVTATEHRNSLCTTRQLDQVRIEPPASDPLTVDELRPARRADDDGAPSPNSGSDAARAPLHNRSLTSPNIEHDDVPAPCRCQQPPGPARLRRMRPLHVVTMQLHDAGSSRQNRHCHRFQNDDRLAPTSGWRADRRSRRRSSQNRTAPIIGIKNSPARKRTLVVRLFV